MPSSLESQSKVDGEYTGHFRIPSIPASFTDYTKHGLWGLADALRNFQNAFAWPERRASLRTAGRTLDLQELCAVRINQEHSDVMHEFYHQRSKKQLNVFVVRSASHPWSLRELQINRQRCPFLWCSGRSCVFARKSPYRNPALLAMQSEIWETEPGEGAVYRKTQSKIHIT